MVKNNWNSKRKSLFKKIFFIPVVLWLILCLIAMIPDASEVDPLTWGELIFTNIFIIPFWFGISFLITHIINFIMKESDKNKEETIRTNNNQNNIVKEEIIKQDKIEIKKEEINNKRLYTCDSIIDAYEYKKMAKYFPKRVYWVFVLRGTLLNILLSSASALIFHNLIGTLVFFIVFEIYVMVLYKIGLEHFAEKTFNSYLKKGLVDTNLETEFYEDYFIRKGETVSLTIKYSDITRCIENDTNFYLEYPSRNLVTIFQKNRCDLELISFIREKFSNLENHLGDSSKFKGVKKYHNPYFIKIMMIVLFVLTIMSLWAAMLTWMIINDINNVPMINYTKNMWIIWLWLPIPILSITLGLKYKNMGFKCTKNIVAGFIVGFLLLIYGSFWLLPTLEEDYNKIYEYQDIIDLELPSKGILEISNAEIPYSSDKTEYTIISAYFDKEDINNLEKEIETSNNWILIKDVKSNLTIFIPQSFTSSNNVYYSVYNQTLDEYNKIPNEEGIYEIYTMKYDKDNKKLEIHKFKYSYK